MMVGMNKATKTTKKFVLSRKNQKGQVAIFVALIFQVVFVFFALLINVGLLVHHKINLQQSTDLAAYYGAMKQAEMMNAVSHVNFQIRQSWKLLTWRYRILGTFGFQKDRRDGNSQNFPFDSSSGNFLYNAEDNTTCSSPPYVAGKGIQDFPFFCVGHGGFLGWPNLSDTTCQVSCNNFDGARGINAIPPIGGVNTGFNGVGGPQIDAQIRSVNNINADLCTNLSKFGSTIFARFLNSYIIEASQRKETIEMLASNLSTQAETQVDLDGGKVLDGVKKTLKNNLTEANSASLENVQAVNGLSQGECGYESGDPRNSRKEFLKKVEFEFINYFIHHCTTIPGTPGRSEYRPQGLYGVNGEVQSLFNLDPVIKGYLEDVFNANHKHIIGFEKNPNCVEYYAVKASATPKIPFLPIEAVKLNAVSVFKPFGGSIGPRYGKGWAAGDSKSTYDEMQDSSKVDQVLPYRQNPTASIATSLVRGSRQLLNFSLFVGDKNGVADPRYVAAYHSMLAKRDLPTGVSFYTNEQNSLQKLYPGTSWPAYDNWARIESFANPASYDSLAAVGTGTRALEITAVAPNQFDLTYYSIDPDFYNNYFVKLYRNFDTIKSAAGGRGPASRDSLRPDFGNIIDSSIVGQVNQPAGSALFRSTFSVKDQIFLKNKIFEAQPVSLGNRRPEKYADHFPYLANTQGSLLTGWTFSSFSNFNDFPESFDDGKTMPFAKCRDAWNNTEGLITAEQNFLNPKVNGEQFPPTPGNCVTGGRTGYSVKMVSPGMVSGSPPEGSEPILNPLQSGFLDF